jgi:hypothetical protein
MRTTSSPPSSSEEAKAAADDKVDKVSATVAPPPPPPLPPLLPPVLRLRARRPGSGAPSACCPGGASDAKGDAGRLAALARRGTRVVVAVVPVAVVVAVNCGGEGTARPHAAWAAALTAARGKTTSRLSRPAKHPGARSAEATGDDANPGDEANADDAAALPR